MGQEINLLANYPKSRRDTKGRAAMITEEHKQIARQYGQEFFDGDRLTGYGGFSYHARFWQPVIPDFQAHYQLSAQSSILDVGCAKGFMLHDFQQVIPGIEVQGVDVSDYALRHAKPEVKPYLHQADAMKLPFPDRSFDVVFSINTIHNLKQDDCAIALQEIQRVSKGRAFITVDAYRDEAEKQKMFEWALTAQTILSVEEWKVFFDDVGYQGDFYWFFP